MLALPWEAPVDNDINDLTRLLGAPSPIERQRLSDQLPNKSRYSYEEANRLGEHWFRTERPRA